MMCALRVSVYLVLSTAFHSESFQLASPKLRRSAVAGETSIAATNDGNNHDPDLFDYFDPLLSPHAYPKGISPEHKPDQTFKEHAEDQQQFPVASDMIAAITKDDPDHFDYFDPLLSPPAYPNGVSSNYRPDQNYKNPDDDSERYNPLRLNIANLGGSPSPPPTRPKIDPLSLFDPTLSPHMYPKGTPSKVIGDESTSFVDSVVPSTNQFPPRRIGILLMDHGSRNKESNERLHELARLYQKSVDAHVIVQAAHMEIATPSIPEGLASLAKAGVDEIICHPFFLSPLGRHVSQDIPAIVDEAIRVQGIQVPVSTTKALGSSTDLMLHAIHFLVQENSSTLLRLSKKLN